MRLSNPKERVFCGECVYFRDSIKWYNRKCLSNQVIRIDYSYKERKEVVLNGSPSTKNRNNRCREYKEK